MRTWSLIIAVLFLIAGGGDVHAAWDTAGVTVVAPVVLKSSVTQTSGFIGARVRQVLPPRASFKDNTYSISSQSKKPFDLPVSHESQGLSAGDATMNSGLWVNIGHAAINDDSVTEFSMDSNNYIIGVNLVCVFCV